MGGIPVVPAPRFRGFLRIHFAISGEGWLLARGEGGDTNPDVLHKPDAKMAKVYRCTYAINPEIVRLPRAERQVPPSLANPHCKDVTTEYMRTSDVSIPVRNERKHSYAYLAVFNDREWIPVCFGKRQANGHFRFEHIGRDIAYLPVYYEEGKVIPFAEPFIVDSKGCIQIVNVTVVLVLITSDKIS